MMRPPVLCLSLLLMACSGTEQAQEDAMAAESAEDVVQVTYDGGPPEGVFEAVSTEGVVLTQTANSDGSIVSMDGEGNAVNGTYTMTENQFCITNEGEEGPACFAYSDLQEDGSWTATNEEDANDTWTVRRVAEQ